MSCATCQRMRERLVNLTKLRQRHRERKQQAERKSAQHEQQGVEAAEGSSLDEGREYLPGVQEGGAGE